MYSTKPSAHDRTRKRVRATLWLACALAIALATAHARDASAENGSGLWLRYRSLPDAVRAGYGAVFSKPFPREELIETILTLARA